MEAVGFALDSITYEDFRYNSTMRRFTYIYTLTDPRDGLIHYVGRTNDPKRRNYEHRSKFKTSYSPWHQELLATGLKPIFSIVEGVYGPGVVAEKMWMKKLKDAGHPLVNAQGYKRGKLGSKIFRGAVIKSAEQIRLERSARIKTNWRKWYDSLTKEEKSEYQRKKLDNGGKEKMIAAQKGRVLPRERVERSAAGLRIALAKPEAKEKMKIRNRAFWDSMNQEQRSSFCKSRWEISKNKGRTGFIKVIP